jgi:hypothetical protein
MQECNAPSCARVKAIAFGKAEVRKGMPPAAAMIRAVDSSGRRGLPGLPYRPSNPILIAGSADLPVDKIQFDHVFR